MRGGQGSEIQHDLRFALPPFRKYDRDRAWAFGNVRRSSSSAHRRRCIASIRGRGVQERSSLRMARCGPSSGVTGSRALVAVCVHGDSDDDRGWAAALVLSYVVRSRAQRLRWRCVVAAWGFSGGGCALCRFCWWRRAAPRLRAQRKGFGARQQLAGTDRACARHPWARAPSS